MRYCENCGAQVEDGARYCIRCGTPVKEKTAQEAASRKQEYRNVPPYVSREREFYAPGNEGYYAVRDTGAAGFGVLGFFFPIVGLILYLVWKDTLPKRAKGAGIGALVKGLLYVGIILLYLVFVAIILGIRY